MVAWSLASFANRDQRAWPGIAAGSARAGLSRSRYLEDGDRLVRRGLLEIETHGVGRGHASTVKLLFAQCGPWHEGEVNANLLEAVLGYSPARGPARLLLTTLTALADENGSVEGLTTDARRHEPEPDQFAAASRLQDALVGATGCEARATPHRCGFQVILDQTGDGAPASPR